MIVLQNNFINVKTWLHLHRAGIKEIDIQIPFADYRSDRKYIYCYAVDLQLYWGEFDEVVPCIGVWKVDQPFIYDSFHRIKLWEVIDVASSLEILIRSLGYFYHYREEEWNPEICLPNDLLWDEDEVIARRERCPYPKVSLNFKLTDDWDLPF